MASRSSDNRESDSGRLGGARADFVASLGRKVQDAREVLAALEDDPTSKSARDELRRRLHALGAGARLLRFDAMSRCLQEALAVLDRGAIVGALREQEVTFVAQVVDDLPALAWGESPPRDVPSTAPENTDENPGGIPVSVLVVGGDALADTLAEDAALASRSFESERTDDVHTALELARAYAPDIILVDADLAQAPNLVETLLDDPLTEPIPVLVVGTFPIAEEAARFVALGVAKALTKPVAPGTLRKACDEILDAREGRTMRVTLGEPTLEQLAERLSEELKRALVHSVDRTARSCRIPLGEGTEVLGALWGAIARVQEIISQKTGGAVHFGGEAPEGTVTLAPWLHYDLPGADRVGERGRGAAADVSLHGRRVVVADDDPGVTWFISDLLRTAGCEVHEALDGNTARDLAFRVQPELIVSDILMPGMDGFALSRALHRDVALRDVPVILLSWKEDLLQRVRELGAGAAAYMKKESDSRAVLARVREVLRPRARIETRLRGVGEVRGRLDGLTPRLLLELVGSIRKDARVSVRDATYVYEIEVRGGHPRRATRTASDGSYQSGERALASLLGIGAGRFVVSAGAEPIRGELTGTLFTQLSRPIAAARGAIAATTGAQTMDVERLVFDDDALEEYLRATPDPARSLIKRIGGGASPRQMLLGGEVAPTLLEDILADLAARGAIRGVEGTTGADLLGPAVEAALEVLLRSPKAAPSSARPISVPFEESPQTRSSSPPRSPSSQPPEPPSPTGYESFTLSDPPPSAAPLSGVEGAPSSLEDAVMRELSDRSPDPGAARPSTFHPAPIIEPSELRKRSSNPPARREPREPSEDRVPLPSLPPDAMVPATATSEETVAAPPAGVTIFASVPPPSIELDIEPEPDEELDAANAAPVAMKTLPLVPRRSAPAAPVTAPEPTLRLATASTAEVAPAPVPRAPKRQRWPIALSFALLLLAVGAFLRLHGGDARRAPAPTTNTAATAPTPPSTTPTAPPTPTTTTAPSASDSVPPGADLPAGYGLIEVSAPASARVRIDGAIAGTGPLVSLVAAPGFHEVRIEQDAGATKQVVEVRTGRVARATSASTP